MNKIYNNISSTMTLYLPQFSKWKPNKKDITIATYIKHEYNFTMKTITTS